MQISIIVAIADNWVIGDKNKLPWYLPADLKHFKEITTGHHIIMGKNTYISIGRPLPNRTNIVLCDDPAFSAEGVKVVNSPEEALELARKNGETEVFIIGGGMVYRTFFPLAKKLYLTCVKAQIKGNITFPEFSLNNWKLISQELHNKDEKNPYDYEFQVYERKA